MPLVKLMIPKCVIRRIWKRRENENEGIEKEKCRKVTEK
jgi:hypothetical protein